MYHEPVLHFYGEIILHWIPVSKSSMNLEHPAPSTLFHSITQLCTSLWRFMHPLTLFGTQWEARDSTVREFCFIYHLEHLKQPVSQTLTHLSKVTAVLLYPLHWALRGWRDMLMWCFLKIKLPEELQAIIKNKNVCLNWLLVKLVNETISVHAFGSFSPWASRNSYRCLCELWQLV